MYAHFLNFNEKKKIDPSKNSSLDLLESHAIIPVSSKVPNLAFWDNGL